MTDEVFAQIKKINEQQQKQWEFEWLSWVEKAKEPLTEFFLRFKNNLSFSEQYLELLFRAEVRRLSRIYGNPPDFLVRIIQDGDCIKFNVSNKIVMSEFEKSIKGCKEKQ